MARQIINASDTLPASRPKINENFSELYARRLVRAGWDFANAAERDAVTLTDEDIGFVCRVASPLGYFLLRQRSPTVVWEQLGGGSGGPAVGRGAWSARPSTPAVGDYYLVTDAPMTELRCWSPGVWTIYCHGVEVSGAAQSDLNTWINQESCTIFDRGPFFSLRAGTEPFYRPHFRATALAAATGVFCEIGVLGTAEIGLGLFGSSDSHGAQHITASRRGDSYPDGAVRTSILHYNGSFTWSAGGASMDNRAYAAGSPIRFYRLEITSAHKSWLMSVDRLVWSLVHQTARTEFLTPSRFGAGIWDPRSGTLFTHTAFGRPEGSVIHVAQGTL